MWELGQVHVLMSYVRITISWVATPLLVPLQYCGGQNLGDGHGIVVAWTQWEVWPGKLTCTKKVSTVSTVATSISVTKITLTL